MVAANGSPASYYVGPDTPNSCAGYSPCETLQHYASNQSKYFTNNTSFTFLSGNHFLNGSISIYDATNLTFMSHTNGATKIMCNNSGGLVFQYGSKLKLVNLSFIHCGQSLPESLQRDGEKAQAALAFGEVTDLLLESVSVSHSTGYGFLGHCVYGNFTITYSLFSFNKGSANYSGGNAIIEYIKCTIGEPKGNLLISFSNFIYGGIESFGQINATGLTLILYQSNINVTLTHVNMEGNNSSYDATGGNLFIHIYNPNSFTSNSISIAHSKFINGTSQFGAGIGVVIFMNSTNRTTLEPSTTCTNVIKIKNTTISKNTGILGVGLYYEFQLFEPYPCCTINYSCCPFSNLTILNATFDENMIIVPSNNLFSYIGNGVAVYMLAKYYKNRRVDSTYNHYTTKFENSIFKNSRLIIQESRHEYTKFALTMMTLATVNMDYFFKSCNLTDNALTALGFYKSKIVLKGDITIKNNTGINGGGMILCESSYLILSKNTSIRLINNHAVQRGGAVYIESSCQHSKSFCFYQLDSKSKWKQNTVSETVSITMTNNTADYAGDHIYGGALDICKIYEFNSTELFESLFKMTPNKTDSHFSAVSSNPVKICFCDNNQKPDCINMTKHISESKYPGEYINVSVVTVGQFNGTVPGTVSYHTRDQNLKVITTGKNCTNFSVPVLSESINYYSTIELFLSSNLILSTGNITFLSASRLQVTVPLKECPCGFQYKNSKCECSKILMQNKINCYIQNHTIQRIPPTWIGSINSDNVDGKCPVIIYAAVCPYDYCNDSIVYIECNDTMLNQDSQCAPNRQGLLCSKCKEGFSLSVGTSNCIKCNTKIAAPLIVLGYGLAGPILVFLLIVLNMTYSDGTFSGMLLYANIITTNGFIFLTPHKISIVFTIVMSWMSMNVGIQTCFYEGMDTYAKVWIGFIFPVYLFLITAVIIFLCRKSQKISSLFGGNIIKVLATLFQLSYTKLLESVVAVLSFTQIQYPFIGNNTENKRLWLADPSLEYFHGKHIPLALVAIVFGLLILAYTLVLLFIQPLQRYSHLRCLSWVAKLKPLIDAYTAPHIIKDNCRYWEGLLLLFRLVLVVVYASNVHNKIDINLTAIISICVLLMTIAWCVGGVYKKLYLNVLNSSYIFNAIAITLAVIYKDKLKQHHFKYSLYSSYTIALATLTVVLGCYVIFSVKNCYSKCKRHRYEALPLNDMDDDVVSIVHVRQF